jgi:hypothetical protein
MLSLTFLASREHVRDLLRASGRVQPHTVKTAPASEVTLRKASAEDSRRITKLATLDSALAPSGPLLLAEVDGRLRAALPLEGGEPIADPFHPGAELVELLRLRAAQLGWV